MSRTQEKCIVCTLEAEAGSSYCRSHSLAVKNLREGYALWNKAYGAVTMKDYFARVSKLAETGNRVQEIIRYFEDHPSEWK